LVKSLSVLQGVGVDIRWAGASEHVL
jgi:hypothetical protein